MNSGRWRPLPFSSRSHGGLLPVDATWRKVLMRAPVEAADKQTFLAPFLTFIVVTSKRSLTHLLVSSGIGSALSGCSWPLLVAPSTGGGATGLKALLENIGLGGETPKCTS